MNMFLEPVFQTIDTEVTVASVSSGLNTGLNKNLVMKWSLTIFDYTHCLSEPLGNFPPAADGQK